jgi:beta-lactamase superfamily II metal-dependent hydrolase
VKDSPNSDNKTQVLILPANHGDAIIIKTFDSTGGDFNMVIDGGTAATFQDVLKNEIKSVPFINIMVLTHIDSDHIGGLIKFVKNAYFKPDQIGKYWFNSKNIKFLSSGENISYGQAKTFEELLVDKGEIKAKWLEDIYVGISPQLPDGIEIEILSPSKEILEKLYANWPDLSDEYSQKLKDIGIFNEKVSQIERGSLEDLAVADDTSEKSIMEDIFNSSSIAFVFKTFDLSILFLSDAHPYFIEQTLKAKGYSIGNKLKVDLVKISHHGSKNNTTKNLLDMIDCDRFIISANGGSSTHTHPDRETIARIIYHPERQKSEYKNTRKIYLNYTKAAIEKKAGEFVNDIDLATGNWQLIENQNLFEHE